MASVQSPVSSVSVCPVFSVQCVHCVCVQCPVSSVFVCPVCLCVVEVSAADADLWNSSFLAVPSRKRFLLCYIALFRLVQSRISSGEHVEEFNNFTVLKFVVVIISLLLHIHVCHFKRTYCK